MFFKDKGTAVHAPLSGHVVTIGDVDEPIFAGKVVGDGVAIIPSDGEVLAPIAGTISFIGEQKHTYGIKGFDGVEILIHLGIDTVKLEGTGFIPYVTVGQRVDVGDRICQMDLELLRSRQFDLTSPVVITSGSMDKIKRLTLRTGQALAAQTVCMRYTPA